jgi:hypothetical protein
MHHRTTGKGATDFEEALAEKGSHRSREQGRAAHAVRSKSIGIHGMTLDCGRTVCLCVLDGCPEERRGDTKSAVSLINGEADNPPGIWLIHEDPAKRTVPLDAGHVHARHDSAPPDWDAVDVGQNSGRYRSSSDLIAQ